ncbi:MAG: hypothetical protein KME50_16175 [Nostoc desertorum CM1-VF14]|jgi:uncharacterized protein with gpF-like domain|nr:hypothetical protein [Nostoc desertorum CM1-VF14]
MVEVCRDIDQGLDALNRKIDQQNKRLRELERNQKECCENKDKNKNNNTNNDLEKRVKELEKTSEALKKGIVETLNNFADIEETNGSFTKAFQGLYEIVIPLMETVSTVIGFLGEDD